MRAKSSTVTNKINLYRDKLKQMQRQRSKLDQDIHELWNDLERLKSFAAREGVPDHAGR